MLALFLLLCQPATPDIDTDAESVRVCPADCRKKQEACYAERDRLDRLLEFERNGLRWSDPVGYRSLKATRDYWDWLGQVYREAYWFSATETWDGYDKNGGHRLSGHARILYDMIGPDAWQAGKDAFPPPPTK